MNLDDDVFCLICGAFIETGSAKVVPGYQMLVHEDCWRQNAYGWTSGERRILRHLYEQGIEVPPKNKYGLLPRSYPSVEQPEELKKKTG